MTPAQRKALASLVAPEAAVDLQEGDEPRPPFQTPTPDEFVASHSPQIYEALLLGGLVKVEAGRVFATEAGLARLS